MGAGKPEGLGADGLGFGAALTIICGFEPFLPNLLLIPGTSLVLSQLNGHCSS